MLLCLLLLITFAYSLGNFYDDWADGHQSRCHHDGPRNYDLRCDSSAHQIVIGSNESVTKQKQNLIIFDIDHTILESIQGFHDAIPSKHSLSKVDTPFSVLWHRRKHFELLFIHKPRHFSIVFRKHFLRILKYIHTDSGFLADLVLYTRANPNYARLVAQGIAKCYKTKYQSSVNGLFCTLSFLILCFYA